MLHYQQESRNAKRLRRRRRRAMQMAFAVPQVCGTKVCPSKQQLVSQLALRSDCKVSVYACVCVFVYVDAIYGRYAALAVAFNQHTNVAQSERQTEKPGAVAATATAPRMQHCLTDRQAGRSGHLV
ncbi:unnamed protein product [Ceratitis capitata]|uniref:(Mediterranean fruit fly) hypothetical protein n=1 Tax=Ceratitis capitata TaxID=7213 RepID=A0A811U3Z5_CERCA|nr:unnamed protein product [Ceratitis capitata]